MKHILMPTDGSACSEQAVTKGLGLAKALNAEVTFLYAVENPITTYATEVGIYPELYEELKKIASSSLAKAKTLAENAGIKAQTQLTEQCRPVDAIREAEKDYDLVVMGTHGRRGFDRFMIGSVAEGALRTSTKPYLLIRQTAEAKETANSKGIAPGLKRLLMPIDGSECSKRSVAQGLELAKDLDASVTFLFVFDEHIAAYYGAPGATYVREMYQDYQKAGEAILEEAKMIASKIGVKADVKLVKHHKPVEAIVETSKDYDIIVMGTHGRRGFDRFMLGSVAEGVLKRSSKPLLLIRQPSHD
jgi:nucleotide-binding universal stress UspA family protein